MRTHTARSQSLKTVLAALWMTVLGAAVLAAVTLPDLSGTWQLNKDASDDAEKVMKEARASGGGGGRGGAPGGMSGGMGMGGGRGHGHGGGGGGRGGDPGARADPAQEPAGGFAALQILQIQHNEPRLVVTDAAGHERVVYTDGRKQEEERSHGGTTAMTASWKDGHIEIVSKPENGPKITETFAMTADGSQLTVTTKLEGGRGPAVTIRRVYDSVKAPAASTPPDEESVLARRG